MHGDVHPRVDDGPSIRPYRRVVSMASTVSALVSLRQVRAREQTTMRRTRPVSVIALVALLWFGTRSEPKPSLHGLGLAITVALLGLLAGALAVSTHRRIGHRVDAILVSVFVLLALSTVTLVWIEPNGAGFLGGFVIARAAATRLPESMGPPVVGLTLAAMAVTATVGADQSLIPVLVNGLGMAAFYRVGLFGRRLRARTNQAEELLIELEQTQAAQLEAATLAERQRLAREMHDVLAHSLSGLSLHLEGARLLALHEQVSAELTDTIDRAHRLALTGLGEAKQAIGMLRDDELPGPEGLHALAGEFERGSGVPCRVTVSGEATELGPRTRLTLYRVAQEALTNIRKHASPSEVDIGLTHEPNGTRLTIEDFAAAGVPTEPAHDHGDDHGYGLTGMRERAELLDGTLQAMPTERGFRVALWVPGASELAGVAT
jgi:signal transduction histidine kinase